MAAIIRMDTSKIQELTVSMTELVKNMSDHGGELAKSVATLDSAWSGGDEELYINNLKIWLVQYADIGQDLQNLVQRLGRELFEWELVDAQKAFGSGHDESVTYAGGALIAAGGVSTVIERSMAEKILLWVPNNTLQAGLEIYHRGREDWAEYQDPSDRAAAIALDSLYVYQKTATKVAIVEAVSASVTTVLLATPAAPVAIPVGMLAGFVSGYAFDWVADEAWDWVDDSGIKNSIVHGGGELIDWGVKGIKDLGSGAGSLIEEGWDYVFG